MHLTMEMPTTEMPALHESESGPTTILSCADGNNGVEQERIQDSISLKQESTVIGESSESQGSNDVGNSFNKEDEKVATYSEPVVNRCSVYCNEVATASPLLSIRKLGGDMLPSRKRSSCWNEMVFKVDSSFWDSLFEHESGATASWIQIEHSPTILTNDGSEQQQLHHSLGPQTQNCKTPSPALWEDLVFKLDSFIEWSNLSDALTLAIELAPPPPVSEDTQTPVMSNVHRKIGSRRQSGGGSGKNRDVWDSWIQKLRQSYILSPSFDPLTEEKEKLKKQQQRRKQILAYSSSFVKYEGAAWDQPLMVGEAAPVPKKKRQSFQTLLNLVSYHKRISESGAGTRIGRKQEEEQQQQQEIDLFSNNRSRYNFRLLKRNSEIMDAMLEKDSADKTSSLAPPYPIRFSHPLPLSRSSPMSSLSPATRTAIEEPMTENESSLSSIDSGNLGVCESDLVPTMAEC